MNEILRFNGTSDESFCSIFRHSLIILHKARLGSKGHLQALFSERDGYLARDPALKDLLMPRARPVFLTMLDR